MKKSILIAEDDTNFGLMLKVFLEVNNFEVTLCDNGATALETVRQKNFHLCILDVMMPVKDGFTVAKTIKQLKPEMPFIFLTAKALKEDQLLGYEIGATDYLIKPFHPEILIIRLNLILNNKNDKNENDESNYKFGNFIFDYNLRLLSLGDTQEKLSPKEAELLKILASRIGEVVTHQEILTSIWQNDDFFTKQSLNVFITKLRKYLEKDSESQIVIENIHNKGFLMKLNVI